MSNNEIQRVEELYSNDNKKSEHYELLSKTRRIRHMFEDNYFKHPLHICIKDRGKDEPIRWGCELHALYGNIHFEEMIHHMIFFEPQKHKDYILKEINKTLNVSTK